MESSSMDTTTPLPLKRSTIPRLDVHPYAHKGAIALQISVLFTTTLLIPEIVYFLLHYKTSLQPQIIFAIVTPIFGAASLLSLCTRTYRLLQSDKKYLPLGQRSRWGLDYFNWNFILGFAVVTVVIALGIAMKPSNIRIVSLPMPLLLLQICPQMVLIPLLQAVQVRRAPIRFSSVARGDPLRPAVSIICEDVLAVDAKQGAALRARWNARYDYSAPFRTLLTRMDWMWGVSGTLVGGACFGIIFGVKNTDVGWACGWGIPWVWVATMSLLTVVMTRRTLAQENKLELEGIVDEA